MKAMYMTHVVKQKYATDACVYSLELPTENQINALCKAQEVIEAQWLNEFPCVVFPGNEGMEGTTRLYENTLLLDPSNWESIDNAKIFLVNENMRRLTQQKEPPFVEMEKVASAAGLKKLFDENVFVVGIAAEDAKVICGTQAA